MTEIVSNYELSDRYRRTEGTVFLTGIQALARIPIEQLRRDRAAGLKTAAFMSGYPGSPLGGLDLELTRAIALAPELELVHKPAVNEELGATAVMGSQLAPTRPDCTHDGIVGVWYGKAPGLDRAGDALRHGVFAGSSPHGGAVVLVGDDPACKSSTMPSSSDATLVDLHMPILYPGTVGECIELGLHAVAMSRASGLWSSMKIVTPIADGSGTVALPALRGQPVMPTVDIDGTTWVPHPSAQFLGQRMVEVEREFREVRLPLAHRYGVENRLNRVSVDPADAWIGLVATGFTYYEMLDALRRLGLDGEHAIEAAGIRVLQLRMPVPFDADLVRTFARGLEEIVVIEEKNPTLEWLIKDALYGGPNQPPVLGKVHEDGSTLMKSWGRLDADSMLDGLRRRLSRRLADRLAPEQQHPAHRELIPVSVARTPFFCSGCPHNWGTKVPDDALVGAGTGCHGMTLLMEPDRVGESIGITAMGNEGAQWIGMAPFVETDHIFQNYGDGTYFHSGQLAIQNCIGAGMHMTFKILYNSTVAMTGGQDSTAPVSVADLCTILLAQGVSKVAITTDAVSGYPSSGLPRGVKVHDRTDIVTVQDDLRATPGVTVLINDQECAAELRRDRRRGKRQTPKTRVVINHRICEGCGDCGDVSNCLSVRPFDTPFGRKTTIDQESCNFDYSCIKGDCPAFMTVEVEDANSGHTRDDHVAELPMPPANDTNHVKIRMAGIGGTGVVTVAQILATAAMLDGWEVRGLDQTGLSQKAGPVISDAVLTRPGAVASNLLGDAQADVLLGFDALVAASDQALQSAGPDTVVVASTHRTPTGRMITEPALDYPAETAQNRLDEEGRETSSRHLDAAAICESMFGSTAPANVLLLGVAVQLGAVPVSIAILEHAIELNGVAVDANLEAFRAGRRYVLDPTAVTDSLPRPDAMAIELSDELSRRVGELEDDDLRSVVTMLTADLVEYQNVKLATEYLDFVSLVAAAEREASPGSTELTLTVARNLHKLMAYKDEYEVARLMLLPEGRAAVAELNGSKTKWHLHPPMLRSAGLKRKLKFGTWSTPMFKVLRAGKVFRGKVIDPFGYAKLRRIERQLPGEYRSAIEKVISSLEASNIGTAVELADLPGQVRGYEHLKMARIETYRDQLLRLSEQ